MKNQSIIYIVFAAVLAGVAGFFGGMKYQQTKSPSPNFANFRGDILGQSQRGGNGNNTQRNFRPVNGEVISQDEKSITVKTQDGGSKIILLNDKTTIRKTEEGSVSEIKTGIQVMVVGVENTDGSITAQNIQLNPQFRMGDGPRGASGSSIQQ